MSIDVETDGQVQVAVGSNDDPGLEDNRLESAAIPLESHRADGVILIAEDFEARSGCFAQVRQHVACGEGRDEEIFRDSSAEDRPGRASGRPTRRAEVSLKTSTCELARVARVSPRSGPGTPRSRSTRPVTGSSRAMGIPDIAPASTHACTSSSGTSALSKTFWTSSFSSRRSRSRSIRLPWSGPKAHVGAREVARVGALGGDLVAPRGPCGRLEGLGVAGDLEVVVDPLEVVGPGLEATSIRRSSATSWPR